MTSSNTQTVKLNIKLILAVIAISTNLAGCASSDYYQHNELTPVFNMYNRNHIVAAPTRVGNYLCGFPFFLIAAIVPHGKSETSINFVNGIYETPATICGAVFGAPFIPFAYICPENPWYENAKSYYREWSCSKPVNGPYVTKDKTTEIDPNIQ